MACLLNVELGSACELGLVSFSKDGVEGFTEDLLVEEPTEVGTHHILHALHGVIRQGCLRHVDWPGYREVCHFHQHRLRRHALNWEADLC